MTYSDKDYFVLLATCQITRGHNKNILIDYAGDHIYNLPDEYIALLELLGKSPISSVAKEMEDEDSLTNFEDFLEGLVKKEMACITSHPETFPPLSTSLHNDCFRIIDGIVEIGKESSMKAIRKFCKEIAGLDCRELQLWFVNDFDDEILWEILDVTLLYDYSYLEIHADYDAVRVNPDAIRKTVEDYPHLKRVYLYSSAEDKRVDVVNYHEDLAPMSLGEIIFVKQPFEGGKCCGQIHFSSLDFSGYWVANMMRSKNGCLYKKVCMDRAGYIRNCPCMEMNYGHILSVNVQDVIESMEFKKWGEIIKDDIEVCKDCVFRYNCSDCRAFRCSTSIYSKPSKCAYDPYTDHWT